MAQDIHIFNTSSNSSFITEEFCAAKGAPWEWLGCGEAAACRVIKYKQGVSSWDELAEGEYAGDQAHRDVWCGNPKEAELLVLQHWEWIPWEGNVFGISELPELALNLNFVVAEVWVIWLYMENRDEGNEGWVKEVAKESVSSCWGQTVAWKPTNAVVGTHSFLRRHTSETDSSAEFS